MDYKHYNNIQLTFTNLYNTWYLFCNLEKQIAGFIREKLPHEISNKIPTITVEDDPDGFLNIYLNVLTENLDEVYDTVERKLSFFVWEKNIHPNFSSISLRLDDDNVECFPFNWE